MKCTFVVAMLLAAALWFAPSATAAVVLKAEGATTLPDSGEQQLPSRGRHRMKAPEIDIANMRDPFESYLTVLEKQSKARLEIHRSKKTGHTPEPLEAFDLGALRLVAIMQMGGKRAAMVENHEGKGYVVRTGSYIGRDNGRVVKITERKLEIVEDEFNAVGEIIQRKAILTLNEVNQ